MSRPGADGLLGRLREWLAATGPGHGARLPPERELALRFAVTRADLRKALAVLQAEGLIERHIGRGTFALNPEASGQPDGRELASRTSPLAAMQARGVVEPNLARLAAISATSVQLSEMALLCDQMQICDNWDAYAELDWRFHNLIAEATGNVLLIEIQRLLNGVRRNVIWGNLRKRAKGPPADYHSFNEHREIYEAIAARDPERSMQAMIVHLGGTKSQLLG